MAFTRKNPAVETATNILARGFKLYFRARTAAGAIDTAADFVDLGVTKGFTPATNETTNELTANLDGVTKTYKKVLASRSKTFTFNTASTGDDDVTALQYGSAVRTASAGTLRAFEDRGASTVGDSIVVFESEDGSALIGYFPSESLRGTGKAADNGFDVYNFEATIQADSAYVPPAALVDFQGAATPEGVYYIVPAGQIQTVLDGLAG